MGGGGGNQGAHDGPESSNKRVGLLDLLLCQYMLSLCPDYAPEPMNMVIE